MPSLRGGGEGETIEQSTLLVPDKLCYRNPKYWGREETKTGNSTASTGALQVVVRQDMIVAEASLALDN